MGLVGHGDAEVEGTGDGEGHVARDKVLLFAQLKQSLDLVQQLLLHPRNISFLRLDGDLSPSDRFAVVQKFNQEPSVDVLLLTT